MVTIFDPQGNPGEIPEARLRDAVKAGAMPAVHMRAPDGNDGFVPADRTHDALRAGATILPIESQEITHHGFWSTLGSDLLGMAKSFAPPTSQEALLQRAKMLKEAITGPDPKELVQSVIDRTNAGYNPLYTTVAPTAEQLGVNVKGMEQSAREGDVGGVLGHAAAVPTTLAAGEILGRVAPAVAEATPPAVRATVKGLNKGLKNVPTAIGGAAGASVGGALGGHLGAEVGGIAGGVLGRELLPKIRIPGEGFGLPNRVAGGPSVAPSYAESLGPVTGGPATAPTFEEFGGTGKLSELNVPAVRDYSTLLPRLRKIARQIEKEEAGTPAAAPEENLAAAGQKSLEAVIDNKVLGVLKKQGEGLTVSMQQLAKDPALSRFTPEQLQASAVRLRDAGKVWGHEAKAGGEAATRIYGIASRP